MKITNKLFNAIDECVGLKEVLVFNEEYCDSITHEIHLVSFSFDSNTMINYGNSLKGRWKIKQSKKQ